jgi:uncharacterized coiled-coil DUF342 family protein
MPTDKFRSHEEIVAAADRELARLQGIERRINAEINRIRDKEWTGPLSKADRNAIAQHRADMITTRATIEELAVVTLGALDRSDEVKRLVNSLAAVRADLNDRKASIEKFGETSNDIKNTLAGIRAIVDKLKGLAELLTSP